MTRRLTPRLVAGGAGVLLLAAAAVLAPWLSPHDPLEMSPALLAAPSWVHPLGTDSFGRDTLARLLYGARVSLGVAVTSILVASVSGTLLGVASAAYRGAVEWSVMRAMDVILAFPPILLAIAAVTFLGQGPGKLSLIIAILYLPTFARLAYGSALTVAQMEYVEAARALGASVWHRMHRHILRNISGPIIVQCSLSLGFAILVESGLSFLGLGVLPPAATWGRMVSESRSYMQRVPMLLVWPSLAIAFAIGAFNTLGDGLRDTLDPRLAGRPGARRRPGSRRDRVSAASVAGAFPGTRASLPGRRGRTCSRP